MTAPLLRIVAFAVLAFTPAVPAWSAPAAPQARPLTLDRIVAVVDDHPILLSDARERLRSLPTRPGEAEAHVLRQAVDALVEEVLVRREASERELEVTDGEVERAIAAVAESNALTPEQVYAEAAKSGLGRDAYRSQVSGQLLEHKLLQLDVVPKVQVPEGDLQALFQKTVREVRSRYPQRVAWIVLRLAPDAKPEVVAATRSRAEAIVRDARGGTPFSTLARQHSDDVTTRSRGGDLGERMPAGSTHGLTLAPEIDLPARDLDVGETSDPIRVRDGFVVLHLLGRPNVPTPTFLSMRESLRSRVYAEKLGRARGEWLRRIRRKHHVELRFEPDREDGTR
jgi:peptidyl-prolyl cis-trans isomerase SurA